MNSHEHDEFDFLENHPDQPHQPNQPNQTGWCGQDTEPRPAGRVLVSVESPYTASNWFRFQQHLQYAVLCNRHAASLGNATFTPHLCNTQVVMYGVQAFVGDFFGSMLLATGMFSTAKKYTVSRDKTLEVTNLARIQSCDKVCVYTDFGVSEGMQLAIDAAKRNNIQVVERKLPDDLMCHVVGKSVGSTVVWGASVAPFAFTGYALARQVFRLAKRFV
jgi:hypothetical protein